MSLQIKTKRAKALFPFARIARLDTDIAESGKGRTQEILQGFRDGHIDILLGTQMIAKGLNFPLVSLIGVLNADSSLAIPDFRAAERTFDLLHQVAGRAGRYRDDGYVIIQTTQPFAPAVSAAAENDLESFYRRELEERKLSGFPPFSRLVNMTFRGRSEEKVRNAAEELGRLAEKLEERPYYSDVEVFSPSPCLIERKAQYYRYHILLRASDAALLLKFAHELSASFRVPSSVYLEIDVDPAFFRENGIEAAPVFVLEDDAGVIARVHGAVTTRYALEVLWSELTDVKSFVAKKAGKVRVSQAKEAVLKAGCALSAGTLAGLSFMGEACE